VVNAFHLRSLTLVAEALGKHAEAREHRDRERVARRAFQEKLFDPVRGLYRDGEGTEHASPHANLFPLAFGLVPPPARKGVVEWGAAPANLLPRYVLGVRPGTPARPPSRRGGDARRVERRPTGRGRARRRLVDARARRRRQRAPRGALTRCVPVPRRMRPTRGGLMQRRVFLKTGGGAALALSGLGRFAPALADTRLRVGLVGAGWYGKSALFRLLQVAPVEVVSLCDVDAVMLQVQQRLQQQVGDR